MSKESPKNGPSRTLENPSVESEEEIESLSETKGDYFPEEQIHPDSNTSSPEGVNLDSLVYPKVSSTSGEIIEVARANVGIDPAVPLCVDLDETLIRTDLLHEAIVKIFLNDPLQAFSFIPKLFKDRALSKCQLARTISPSVELLPYRASILDLIIEYKRAGARVCLTTASPLPWAQKIADHLALFDEVFATTEEKNLKGTNKRDFLVRHFGPKGFDYVGDSISDLPVWSECRKGYSIDGVQTVLRRLPEHVKVVPHSSRSHTPKVKRWIKAIRLHQWVKNLLVIIPLVMAHKLNEFSLLAQGIAAFVSFSFTASAVYIINDILDIESDRGHPSKRHRPFAAGEIALVRGGVATVVLLCLSLLFSTFTPSTFLPVLVLYLVVTSFYSIWLKRIPIVDIFVLASLYSLRIFAGAAATSIFISPWLLAFSLFFFLGLASVKRFVEFNSASGDSVNSRRGYLPSDTPWIANLGMGSGLISVLVLALYVQAPDITKLYSNPLTLWLLSPLILFWVSRIWFLAHRKKLSDDPVVFALRDKTSLVIGLLAILIVIIAI